ncbi:hypothetical protein WJX72_003276 [[Myrmecia] bisecta]|uniref:Major facilitator superfamily (MFS) profile domain-containing protein n=1 Tax=[Myrmecia] bisecta TaxID=41462 RepID=A0AAW1PWW6_9CHLO
MAMPSSGREGTAKASKLDPLFVFSVWLTNTTQGMCNTIPYTISVYMVRRWYQDRASEERIGQLTGVLAASASAAQVFTAFLWGVISDHIGRKPVILLGSASAAVSVTILGLAPVYAVAVGARVIGGLLNGVGTGLKTLVGEACTADNQAKAMSYMSLGWGMGTVLGPMVGGFLALPCDTFASSSPLCKPGALLQNKPFLLPCLVAGILAMLAVVSNAFLLEETLPRLKRRAAAKGYHAVEQEDSEPGALELTALEQPQAGFSSRKPSLEQLKLSNKAPGRPWLSRTDTAMSMRLHHAQQQPSKEHSARTSTNSSLAEDQNAHSGQHYSSSHLPWWKQRDVQLTTAGYGLIAFLFSAINELTPIYSSAPADRGGLALHSAQFAGAVSFGGAVLVLYALFLYPRHQKWVGPLWCVRTGLLGIVPAALVLPLASLFVKHRIATQAILYLGCAIKAWGQILGTTSAIILMTRTAPAENMGAVNGAGQTLASFGRAAGPALGGILWALTIQTGLPGHQYLAFACTAAAALLAQLLYVRVRLPPDFH